MSTIDLRFQDANKPSGYLLEELLIATGAATSGGAIFAWANAPGAKAFLDDPKFVEFIANGNFELVVGLDSITDEGAVLSLIAAANKYPKLTIRAFLNDESGLFHPKLAWFWSGDALTLIVGSGNLTMGGLKGNWEAFAVARLKEKEAKDLGGRIQAWLKQWSGSLIPITDPKALERAKKNTGNERTLKRKPKAVPKEETAAEAATALLVAEIPKAAVRWSQANFDLDNYEKFFGAKVGSQRRITMYQVAVDGSLGDLESRPSVEVKSQNYRFELAAAKGIDYPAEGRPIGVFMRLDTGDFLYMVLLPGGAAYTSVSAFLSREWAGPARQVRRVRTDIHSLKAAWPNAPLWRAALPKL